jgi:predicted deacylase
VIEHRRVFRSFTLVSRLFLGALAIGVPVAGSLLASVATASEVGDEGDDATTAEVQPAAPDQAPVPPAPPTEIRAPSPDQARVEPVPPKGLDLDSKLPGPFRLLGVEVAPGESQRVPYSATESLAGQKTPTPVLVAHGKHGGDVLCLTAAIHGDELNGIEIVRRVLHNVDPDELHGTIVGVPIVNLPGFQRGSRYLPDRRDLNRYFPGDPGGSSASRIAHNFFETIIRRCDRLVDIHTGSLNRTNLTQLRADLTLQVVRDLAAGFGDMVVLHSVPPPGTLRRAATDAGVPTVTVEAGEPMRLESNVVERGVGGIDELLIQTGMIKRRRFFGDPQPVYFRSTWVRAEQGGILLAEVELGEKVSAGGTLGIIVDPISNAQTSVLSLYDGTVLGMAVNQFVMPGFALFRVGIRTSQDDVGRGAPAEADGRAPTESGPASDEEEHDEGGDPPAIDDTGERPE